MTRAASRYGDTEGATSVEYALMVSLVAVVIVVTVAILGLTLNSSYECSAENVRSLSDEPGSVNC